MKTFKVSELNALHTALWKAQWGDTNAAKAIEESAAKGDNALITAKAATRVAKELRQQAIDYEELAQVVDPAWSGVLVLFDEDEWMEIERAVRRVCKEKSA